MNKQNNTELAIKVIECVSNPEFYENLAKIQTVPDNYFQGGLVFVIEHNKTGRKIMFDLTFNDAENAIIDFMKANKIIVNSPVNNTKESLVNNIGYFVDSISEEMSIERDYFCKIRFIFENNEFIAQFVFIDKPTQGMLMFFENIKQMVETRIEEIDKNSQSKLDLIQTQPISYSVQ